LFSQVDNNGGKDGFKGKGKGKGKKGKDDQRTSQKRPADTDAGNNKKQFIKCFNCGEMGHFKSECRKPQGVAKID
jgi:hypothetical protein